MLVYNSKRKGVFLAQEHGPWICKNGVVLSAICHCFEYFHKKYALPSPMLRSPIWMSYLNCIPDCFKKVLVREQGSAVSKGGKGVREQGSEVSKGSKGVREQGSEVSKGGKERKRERGQESKGEIEFFQ